MSVLQEDFILLFNECPWVEAVWVLEMRGDASDVMSVLHEDFTLLFIERLLMTCSWQQRSAHQPPPASGHGAFLWESIGAALVLENGGNASDVMSALHEDFILLFDKRSWCGIRMYSMTMSGTCATHVLTKAKPKAVWSRRLRCMQVSLCWWSVNCCVQACKQTQRDTQGTKRAKCAHVGNTHNTWAGAALVLENRGDAPDVMSALHEDFILLFDKRSWCGIRMYSMTMSGTCATHVLTKAKPKAVWSRRLRCMQVSLCWWSVNCCVQANTERHTRNETREMCSCWEYKQHLGRSCMGS